MYADDLNLLANALGAFKLQIILNRLTV